MKRIGRGYVEPEMIILEICKYMNWDYQTYLKQPYWLIDLILSKQKIDAEFAEIQTKKLKSKQSGRR